MKYIKNLMYNKYKPLNKKGFVMLRTIFLSSIILLFTSCIDLNNSIILHPPTPKAKELNSKIIAKIAVPVREHGYSNFQTHVIKTQVSFDDFLRKIKQQEGWNKKENFFNSLLLNPMDFRNYNLLLYRITEGSGSTVLSFDVPKGDNNHVIINIGRNTPEMGTSDMAYYLLAYKVSKNVIDISFDNGIKKSIIINRTSIHTQNNIPKKCLEWYDGCNSCGRVGTEGEPVCTEMACPTYGKFRCTKWKE